MSKKVKVVVPMEIGYKVVVKQDDGRLTSCTSAGLKVRYIVDRFVSPRMWGGPLCVFSSKWLALGFVEKIKTNFREEDIKVYRCKYIPTIVNHVWRYRDNDIMKRAVADLPEKTVLAKKVKLLKRII